jgi:hypothetical protein
MTVNTTEGLRHQVDQGVAVIKENISDVGDNVKATKELTHDVDDDVTAIKGATYDIHDNITQGKDNARSVNDNVEQTSHSAQHLSKFFYTCVDYFLQQNPVPNRRFSGIYRGMLLFRQTSMSSIGCTVTEHFSLTRRPFFIPQFLL